MFPGPAPETCFTIQDGSKLRDSTQKSLSSIALPSRTSEASALNSGLLQDAPGTRSPAPPSLNLARSPPRSSTLWQRKGNLSAQRDLMGGLHCFSFQKRSPSIQAIGRRLELEPRNPDTHRFSPPGPTKLPLSGLGVSQRAYFPPRAGKQRRGWCVEWHLCY